MKETRQVWKKSTMSPPLLKPKTKMETQKVSDPFN